MAGFLNDTNNNISRPSGSTITTETKPTHKGSSTSTSTTVPVGEEEKVKLSETQKNEMRLLGLNPENSNDVTKYLNMTPEEKTELQNQIYEELEASESQLTIIQYDKLPTEEEIKEILAKLNIDINSEEWKNQSPQEKLNNVLSSAARSIYGEEWDNFTKEEKIQKLNELIKSEITKYVPGWDTFSAEQKLNTLSEFINLAVIAKEKGMKLSELADLKKQKPNEYAQLEQELGDKKVDLLKYGANKRIDEINAARNKSNEELDNYLIAQGFNRNDNSELFEPGPKRAIAELEYLNTKKENGVELNKNEQFRYDEITARKSFHEYCEQNNISKEDPRLEQHRLEFYREFVEQNPENKPAKIELKTLETLAKMNGGSLENIKAGENSVTDIKGFDQNDPAKKLENLNIIADYFIKTHNFDKLSDEDRTAIIQTYKASEQEMIIAALAMREMITEKTAEGLNNAIVVRAVEHDNSNATQTLAVNAANRQLDYLQKNKLNTDGFNEYAENTFFQKLDKEHAQQAGLNFWEHGKDFGNAANKGIAKRKDAPEVFDGLNGLIYKSDKISDEMKKYYAQTSVEYLSPDKRDIQAERLKGYNSDSFNEGVKNAYENIKSGKTSSEKSSASETKSTSDTSSVSNTKSNNVNIVLDKKEVESLKEAYNYLKENLDREQVKELERAKLDLSKLEDQRKFLNFVNKHSSQIGKYLTSKSQKDKELFIQTFCRLAGKTQIMSFLETNPSFYSLIMKYASGLDKFEVYGIVKKDVDTKKLISELNITPPQLASKYPEDAANIAILTENYEVALAVIINPARYGFNRGDERNNKLNEIVSKKQLEKIRNSYPDPKTSISLNNIPAARFLLDKNNIIKL